MTLGIKLNYCQKLYEFSAPRELEMHYCNYLLLVVQLNCICVLTPTLSTNRMHSLIVVVINVKKFIFSPDTTSVEQLPSNDNFSTIVLVGEFQNKTQFQKQQNGRVRRLSTIRKNQQQK